MVYYYPNVGNMKIINILEQFNGDKGIVSLLKLC
jgi:hypothetical protein